MKYELFSYNIFGSYFSLPHILSDLPHPTHPSNSRPPFFSSLENESAIETNQQEEKENKDTQKRKSIEIQIYTYTKIYPYTKPIKMQNQKS